MDALDANDGATAKPDDVGAQDAHYSFRLYVSGNTTHSAKAIVNLRKFCENHLKGCYELQVLDLVQQPQLAAEEQLIALPTLLKDLPDPPRRFIGDLSDTQRLLGGLDIVQKSN